LEALTNRFNSDGVVGVPPLHIEIEDAGSEEAVGVVGLIGWARVVAEHVFDELLLFFFQCLESFFGGG